jgi:MFS family permease
VRRLLEHPLLIEPPRPAVVRESRHAQWYVVATVCVGAFMGQLDASIVTIALPSIGHGFDATRGAVEWVALAYLLMLIACVAAVGRLADALGRKLLYTYGFAVFTASSVLCGLAPSLPLLIGARVVQALGAAMLQANSVALIADAVPRPLLPRALGAQGAAQALGLALGPALGGGLLALGGWRLIFLVNLPAGMLGLALGWLLLPRSRSKHPIGKGDLLGALRTLRRPAIATGLSSGVIAFLALFGTLFAVPYYLSTVHRGAALAGAELAVLPVAIGLSAPVAGRLVGELGAMPLTSGGMVLAAAGLALIAAAQDTGGLLAGLALTGVGLGAFIPANNSSVMAAAPGGRTGLVGGLLNMTRGAGTALGVAVTGALYTAGGLTLATAALAGAALFVGLALLSTRAAERPPTPPHPSSRGAPAGRSLPTP